MAKNLSETTCTERRSDSHIDQMHPSLIPLPRLSECQSLVCGGIVRWHEGQRWAFAPCFRATLETEQPLHATLGQIRPNTVTCILLYDVGRFPLERHLHFEMLRVKWQTMLQQSRDGVHGRRGPRWCSEGFLQRPAEMRRLTVPPFSNVIRNHDHGPQNLE